MAQHLHRNTVDIPLVLKIKGGNSSSDTQLTANNGATSDGGGIPSIHSMSASNRTLLRTRLQTLGCSSARNTGNNRKHDSTTEVEVGEAEWGVKKPKRGSKDERKSRENELPRRTALVIYCKAASE